MSADRHRLHPPDHVLRLLDPQPGHIVADVGCGPGFFTVPIAERVRPTGHVVALDTVPEMLAYLRRRVGESLLGNVTAVRSQESRLPLGIGVCDRVLLAFLLHELEDPPAFLAEVRRVLRPDGLGVLADWYPTESPAGPPMEVRVPPARAAERLRAAGLTPYTKADLGPFSYAMAFRPARR